MLAILAMVMVKFTYAGDDCVGLSKVLPATPLQKSFIEAVIDLWKSNPDKASCSSYASVADAAINGNKISGRRLEDKKELNIAQAQANLDKALADPAIRKRIEAVNEQVSDDKVRMYLEAVILDEEGFYGARNLRIKQLGDKLKWGRLLA